MVFLSENAFNIIESSPTCHDYALNEELFLHYRNFIYLMKTIFSFQFMCSDIRSIFHHHHDFYDMKGSESWGWQTVKHYFALLTSINFIISLYVIIETSLFPSARSRLRISLEKCHKTVCRSYSSIMNDDYQIMAWLPIEKSNKKVLYCFGSSKTEEKEILFGFSGLREEVKQWNGSYGKFWGGISKWFMFGGRFRRFWAGFRIFLFFWIIFKDF